MLEENENGNLFQVPAIVEKITTMSDGGLRLQVDTQELREDEKTKVFSLHKKFGYFVFKEGDISQDDLSNIPDFIKEFKEDKSPSQRMRAVLFKIYEKRKSYHEKLNVTFDDFYKKQMEVVIKHFKTKLSEL